jgi:hypothetical protein
MSYKFDVMIMCMHSIHCGAVHCDIAGSVPDLHTAYQLLPLMHRYTVTVLHSTYCGAPHNQSHLLVQRYAYAYA